MILLQFSIKILSPMIIQLLRIMNSSRIHKFAQNFALSLILISTIYHIRVPNMRI